MYRFSPLTDHVTQPKLLSQKIFSDLVKLVDDGNAAIFTLLDLSAAFDTVDYDILLSLLEQRFGVSNLDLPWLASYLTDREQTVYLSGAYCLSRRLDFGVPQGSVLGPILFLLYTSPSYDITLKLAINCHFFADDTQCYTGFMVSPSNDSQTAAMHAMERCISEMDAWFSSNMLKNNVEKW